MDKALASPKAVMAAKAAMTERGVSYVELENFKVPATRHDN